MMIPSASDHCATPRVTGAALIEPRPQPWQNDQYNTLWGTPRIERCAATSDDPRLTAYSVITPRGELLVCFCRQCGWRKELWIHLHDAAVNQKLTTVHRNAVRAGLASPGGHRDPDAASRYLKKMVLTGWAEEHEHECAAPRLPDFVEHLVNDAVLDTITSLRQTRSAGSVYLIDRDASVSVLRYEREPEECVCQRSLPGSARVAERLFSVVAPPRAPRDQLGGAVAVIPTSLFVHAAITEPPANPEDDGRIVHATTACMLGVWICVTNRSYGWSGIMPVYEPRLKAEELPPICWQALTVPSAYIDGAIGQTWR